MIRRKRDNRGFTLAEVMMAVAIMAILAGVTFVGVNRYLKSMALLERNGIAKEIFVAAQNHLTIVKGQDYLGIAANGFGDEDGTSKNGCYTMGTSSAITDLMLPFGAVDETVRASGNYFIRYQKETGQVLDVFYWTDNGGRFDCKGVENSDFDSALEVKDTDGQLSWKGGVLGWFGGADVNTLPNNDPYSNPEIIVNNDDILFIEVVNKHSSTVNIKLFVEGLTSGAAGYIEYRGVAPTNSKHLVLDDVANINLIFSKINDSSSGNFGLTLKSDPSDPTKSIQFIPGEDIRVYAEAYDTGVIAGIGRSAAKTTNSLFQAVETDGATSTAYVSSFRHLENLYKKYSSMTLGGAIKAVQTKDLYWNKVSDNLSYVMHVAALRTRIGSDYPSGAAEINVFGAAKVDDYSVYYLPINPLFPDDPAFPSFEMEYDGAGYSINDVQIKCSGNAGLIGNMAGGSVHDLRLVNFSVTSTEGHAGALAGELKSNSDNGSYATKVTNVIAYNDDGIPGLDNGDVMTGNIVAEAEGKAAGGLIGYMQGANSSVDFGVNACAAALFVKSEKGDAGGLIGKTDGELSVKDSYSGGHTLFETGTYHTADKYWGGNDAEALADKVNVIGGGDVGGLIGNASGTIIAQCYSTCSAYGTGQSSNVGGLVGKAAKGGDDVGGISDCYATGYVSGSGENAGTPGTSNASVKILPSIGAFAGNVGAITPSNCNYFMIINERYDSTNPSAGYQYLSAVGNTEEASGISALDASVSTYDDFVGADKEWEAAEAYDTVLKAYYKNKYNLKSIKDLDSNLDEKYYVNTHYGDWPAPEIMVINS